MEAGEGVWRRTHDHGGEIHILDGLCGDGGGDWTLTPGSKISDDKPGGDREPRHHDSQPEQLDQSGGGRGYEDQAMNGGIFQELSEWAQHVVWRGTNVRGLQ